ncbi:hypothetical protein MMC30_001256 [Trapelia coarctata]|nr:hypothetical protein [Trapelia coarctata]
MSDPMKEDGFTAGHPMIPLENPSEVLRRSFSANNAALVLPNLAERVNRVSAGETDVNSQLRVIGLGTCGTVFELPGTNIAYKKGVDTLVMWNDFRLNKTVYNAIREAAGMLQKA